MKTPQQLFEEWWERMKPPEGFIAQEDIADFKLIANTAFVSGFSDGLERAINISRTSLTTDKEPNELNDDFARGINPHNL